MIPALDVFKNALAQSSRTFKANITIGGQPIDGDIQSVDAYKGASPEMAAFGALYIPYFTAKIANLNTPLRGQDVRLSVSILTSVQPEVWYSVGLGFYHVTEVKVDRDYCTVKAIGSAFYKMAGKTLTASHGTMLPHNIQGFLDKVAEEADVTIQADFPTALLNTIIPPIRSNYLKGKSFQIVLGAMAGALGAFVTEDYQGNIVIKEYGSGDTADIAADRSITPPTYDEYEYEITGIKCIVYEEGESTQYPDGLEYTAGDLINYTFKNRIVDSTLFNSIAERAIGLHYYPGLVPMALGNPLIDPWDILSVTDVDGIVRRVFPLQIHHHIDGGLSTDIDADMPKTDGVQTGAVTQSINNISDQVATIDASIISALEDKAEDDEVVHLAGEETITGEKTFTEPINGTSSLTQGIPYGKVDSTSTDTAFTATVPGITELKDGTTVMLENGVVTSASGFTLNINGLGAKPVFNNLTAATRDTTIFNVNYTMLFVYDSNRVVDNITGAWICYRGYDSNTNTIGYQLRSNSMSLPMSDIVYRYRLLFTSADGTKFVPANSSTSTNATAARFVNQRPIDPFGDIVYYGTTAKVDPGSHPAATALWRQYGIALGYSFNKSGAALTMTPWKAVYLKCAPQNDGSAIIDANDPYVQSLPTTEDGKIYIFLGVAYSATNIELLTEHPVYYYKNGSVRLWANCTADEIVAMTGDEIVAICQ